MSNPWTPGPWEMCGMSVCDKDGDPIAHMAMPASDAGMAAVMQDARLIAAAPEMAKSLEELQGEFFDLLDSCLIVGTSTRHMDRLNKLENNARALLARIRGDAP